MFDFFFSRCEEVVDDIEYFTIEKVSLGVWNFSVTPRVQDSLNFPNILFLTKT